MKILVLQTVRSKIEIGVFESIQGKFSDKMEWLSERNEIQVLVDNIDELLKKSEINKSELEGVLIFSGIGNFSSTRIGVTVANGIASFLGIELFEMTIDENEDKDLEVLVSDFFKGSPVSVKVALPKYKSEAKITIKSK